VTFDQWFRLSSLLLLGDGLLALWMAGLLGSAEALLVGLGLILGLRSEAQSLSPRSRRIAQRIAMGLLPLLLAADVLYLADSLLHGLIHLLTLLGLLKLFLRTNDRDFRDLFIISFFQLVAASATTTSVGFLVVFLLYLFLGIWAFLLLHLKQEGVDRSPEWSALPAKLLPTSLAVSCTVLLLSVVLFIAIPRAGRAFLPRKAMAGAMVAGFSEKVELGSLGKIQTETSIVMRIRLPNVRPEDLHRLPLRWRGVAFDRFDGTTWTMTGPEREPPERSRGGLATFGAPSGAGRLVRQEIQLEPIGTDVLFAAPRLIQMLGDFPRLFTDARDTVSLPSPPSNRMTYLALSELETADSSALSGAEGTYPDAIRETYLQLPPLVPRVRALAEELARGARTPLEVAHRVEAHLRERYRYTLDLQRDSRFDPLDDFLFVQREGNCEYFAASMAVLLRAAGIPARVVNGFQRGEWNEYGGYLAVKQRDAHSWVEVYFPRGRWLTFDPSPRASSEASRNALLARVSRYLDALGMRWDRYVVSYNLSDQLRIVSVTRRRADLLRWQALGLFRGFERAAKAAAHALAARLHAGGLLLLAITIACAGLVVAVRKGAFGWGRFGKRGGQGTVQFYRELLGLLARKGFVKGRDITPREFAASVEADGRSEFAGVSQVVESYYRVRYGARQISASEHARIAQILHRLATGQVQRPAAVGRDRIPSSDVSDA
jgi:transglutaminase-like putative cysteine protease